MTETLKTALEVLVEVREKELEVLKKYLESGVSACADEEEEKENSSVSKEKATRRKSKKKEEEEKEVDGNYESMTSQALYKECCNRGISSKCKERNKAYLIKVLEADDAEKMGDNNEDDWEEEEKTADEYEGKKAGELYKMCVERGIKTAKRLSPAEYIKLLRESDEKKKDEASEDDWDMEDDWDI